MKKLSGSFTLFFTLTAITGCSHGMRRPALTENSSNKNSVREIIQVSEVEKEENLHEMAEADAPDDEIKGTVGAADIDEEITESENEIRPISSHFLKNKKTKRMLFWVDYFTNKNRDRFQRFINNGEEYRHHIEEIFKSYGPPPELYYVGLIESGYYLGARSHAKAVGPWQFMPGTGKNYGLKLTSELDERQDLFKATHAAARYFKNLYNIFSSWELALAAYNAGENGVIRRIMKYGTRDFYELSKRKHLHSETINYVPKVLAAMYVVENAKKYGFHLPKKEHRLFDNTELKVVGKNLSLNTIASRINVDANLLRKLNPELRKNSTPRYYNGNYAIRIPKSKYAYRLDELNKIEAPLRKPETPREISRRTASSASTHEVRPGETLTSVAKKYQLSAGELATMNNFKTWKTRIKVGQKLLVARKTAVKSVAKTQVPKIKNTGKPIIYKVRPGDTLTDIARIFNLNLNKVKKTNGLKHGRILAGQITLPDTQKGIYIVRPGDHLTKISQDFKQPIEALIKLNSLKRGTIYAGQKIIVNVD